MENSMRKRGFSESSSLDMLAEASLQRPLKRPASFNKLTLEDDSFEKTSDALGGIAELEISETGGPRHWIQEEDIALRNAILKHGPKKWKQIASSVPGRTDTQCLQRWTKVLQPGLVKGAWSKEEDDTLRALVQDHIALHQSSVDKITGEVNARIPWNEIYQNIPGRNAKQCRERWCYNLDPTIKRGCWTAEEDQYILTQQRAIGNRWARIARQLPGRTEHTVKTRYRSLKRAAKREWKPEEDKKLRGLHAVHGSRWADIADHFSNRTKHAVQTRYKLLMAEDTKQRNERKNGACNVSKEPQTTPKNRQGMNDQLNNISVSKGYTNRKTLQQPSFLSQHVMRSNILGEMVLPEIKQQIPAHPAANYAIPSSNGNFIPFLTNNLAESTMIPPQPYHVPEREPLLMNALNQQKQYLQAFMEANQIRFTPILTENPILTQNITVSPTINVTNNSPQILYGEQPAFRTIQGIPNYVQLSEQDKQTTTTQQQMMYPNNFGCP